MENQQDHTVDNRIIKTSSLSLRTLRKYNLEWFAAGENADYFSPDFLVVSEDELNAFQTAAKEIQRLAIEAMKMVADQNRWKEASIPEAAIPLVKYSIENELDQQLVGRYDFSGGMDGLPIKFLEFNADTCSLMPETALVQDKHAAQEKRKLKGQPYNFLINGIAKQLERILEKHPNKSNSLLITTLGYEEDWHNADVVAQAASYAGFEEVKSSNMEDIIFSPDEGIYIEKSKDEFRRYDFLYKVVPWEFIAYEEPELLGILDNIIRGGHGVVLNPAYTMLLQSKAIMKFMYELAPDFKYLLKTTFNQHDFPNKKYVRKPVFGRMGENIGFFDGNSTPAYETEGDYSTFPPVYQELAEFNIDEEEHRYQPSIFWTGESSALCFRRQDDLVIDDDAEFVGHIIK